jgi:sugar diacid utilization regulator
MGSVDGAMHQALQGLFDRLSETYGVRFAVVSSTCPSLRDLPTVAEHARDTTELLRETGATPRLTSTRELELLRLLGRRDGLLGARQHAEELLRPLAEHDAANGGALLPTITAFVRCHGQIRSTAAALSVHENTVRYRLNRIRDVSSIEPECLESLLGVALSLQVRDLLGPAVEFSLTGG